MPDGYVLGEGGEKLGKKSYTRWLFVLPAIIIVVALFIYPICSSVVYSFTNKNLIKPAFKFIGLKNYAEVLTERDGFFPGRTDCGWIYGGSGIKAD